MKVKRIVFFSQLTGVLIISVPGEIYVHGAIYSLTVVSIILAVLVINHSILPVFYENNIINCYEVRFEIRTCLQKVIFSKLIFIAVLGTEVR